MSNRIDSLMSGAFYALHYSRYTRWTSSSAALFWTQALIIDRRLNSSHWPRSSTERRFHQLAHRSSGRTTSCGRWVLGMLAYCDRSSRDMVYIGFSLSRLCRFIDLQTLYIVGIVHKNKPNKLLNVLKILKSFFATSFPLSVNATVFETKQKASPS